MRDVIKKSPPLFLLVWLVVGLLIPVRREVLAAAAAAEAPEGFRLILERPGAALYRRDSQNGTPDYVQVVDLAAGASIDPLHGRPAGNEGKKSRGLYEGTNPAFGFRSIYNYWEAYAQAQPEAFCVTNGQFYYVPENPTPLALPLKVEGTVVAEGFGFPQYPEKQLMLALWPGQADILPLTQENLYGTTAPDVIGGLTEEANKKPKNAVGRTFAGIWDANGDGSFETVAILTAGTATQKEAARILYSFGAAKVMMLDGGGSTQLVCGGQGYMYTERALPQALGISAAPPGGPPPQGESPAAVQEGGVVEGVTVVVPSGTAAEAGGGELDTDLTDLHGSSLEGVAVEGVTVVVPSGTAAEAGGGEFDTDLTDGTDLNGSSLEGALGEEARAAPAVAGMMAIGPGRDPGGTGGGQAGGVNPGDLLWVPAVISPVSLFILLASRRRNTA